MVIHQQSVAAIVIIVRGSSKTINIYKTINAPPPEVYYAYLRMSKYSMRVIGGCGFIVL